VLAFVFARHRMTERTLILSDLHLGRPDGVRRAVELELLLEPGSTVILNGDTAELHHPAYQTIAEDELGALQAIAATRGVHLKLLSGNHDPLLSGQRMLTLAQGQILVTHGDAFHPAVAPWSVSAPAMRRAWEETMRSTPAALRDSSDTVFNAARDAAIAEWLDNGHGATQSTLGRIAVRPWSAVMIAWYWMRYPRLACRFAAKYAPQARILVVGHSHRAGRWRVGCRTVLNTGSFSFPGRPCAAILQGDTVSLWPVGRAAQTHLPRYSLAARPVASGTLPRGTATPAAISRDESGRPNAASMTRPALSTAARPTPIASSDPSNA